MALSLLSRYDPSAIDERDGEVLVVGAGIAGLSAARVLADAYSSVTVLERDTLQDGGKARSGVPQGPQPHLLLRAGHATAADLFPGITESLIDAGAIELDWTSDLLYYEADGLVAGGPDRIPLYAASRPVFEQVLRDRIQDHPAIRIVPSQTVTDYQTDDDGSRVTGVHTATDDNFDGDLIIDASGRSSRTSAWLERNGFSPPPVDAVTVDVTYRSVLVSRPPSDRTMIVIPPSPPRKRGGGAFPIEGDRWLLTMQGIHGTTPPETVAGMIDHAAQLPVERLHDIISTNDIVSDPIAYPFPSSQWRRYDSIESLPDGLLIIGDAVASFNPIYGQGMTASLLQSLQLHHHLATNDVPDGSTFVAECTPLIQNAWQLAVASDFRFAETSGSRPRGMSIMNWYLDKLLQRAQSDPHLAATFGTVAMMEQPPKTLLHPRIVWRVLGT